MRKLRPRKGSGDLPRKRHQTLGSLTFSVVLSFSSGKHWPAAGSWPVSTSECPDSASLKQFLSRSQLNLAKSGITYSSPCPLRKAFGLIDPEYSYFEFWSRGSGLISLAPRGSYLLSYYAPELSKNLQLVINSAGTSHNSWNMQWHVMPHFFCTYCSQSPDPHLLFSVWWTPPHPSRVVSWLMSCHSSPPTLGINRCNISLFFNYIWHVILY